MEAEDAIKYFKDIIIETEHTHSLIVANDLTKIPNGANIPYVPL